MVYPQHGQVISATDATVAFCGATVHPGERIRIEARRRSGAWTRLADTTTLRDVQHLESGDWYYWSQLWVRIPDDCWSDAGGGMMSAEVRARSLDYALYGTNTLFTFDVGFDPHDYTDVAAMWDAYGHGHSVTIYAP
jgi:hypothetical protein